MGNRKQTPVKPNSEFNCTLYLADLGLAIKLRGRTRIKSHSWHNNILRLDFVVAFPQQAAYTGDKNIIVFHETGRMHRMTAMRTGELNNMYIEFDGCTNVQFEEPKCEWFSLDLEKIDEALQLPKPKITSFYWSYSEPHHTSLLYVNYTYQSRKTSHDTLGANYIRPNKLDILLEEIQNASTNTN